MILRCASAGALTLLLALTVLGCPSTPPPPDPPPTASAAPPPPPPARVLVDLVNALSSCDVEHEGPFLDFGSEASRGRWAWSPGPSDAPVEHDGSTWFRVLERRVALTFYLPDAASIFVAARAVGYSAKSAQVLLDDQPLGTLSFARDQIRIAKTEATTLPVDPGNHTLTLRFNGRARDSDALADLDWLHVGVASEAATPIGTYAPPTPRDLVAQAAALSGVPHRAIALRSPGLVRCPLRVPTRAALRVSVGLQGTGEAEAEIRVRRDGKKPEVLRAVHLEANDKATWQDLEIPLAGMERGIGGLELVAKSSPKGSRVLFGDPAIVMPTPAPAPTPTGRLAVLLVLDGTEQGELPPWAPPSVARLPALSDLAEGAATFDRHRAPSTVVASSVATLLTGLLPSAHGLVDANARLPASITTLAAIAHDASLRTAMFTGVPATFHAFGFDRAWEKFVEISPASGDPATAPIDQATQWIIDVAKASGEAKMLVVIHARGGHPPWDVGAKELAAAPPAGYSGVIEPRRAAQMLAKLRKKHARGVLNDADRLRIRALETLALAGQDRAIGALIAALRAANLWDATLFAVTGDVASGADPSTLFADGLDLREPLLALPLYVHFPSGVHAGRRVLEGTEVSDLARTALAALGLTSDKRVLSLDVGGRDLATLVAESEAGTGSPLIATREDRYSVRWGELVLAGRRGKPPELCDLSVDPTCAFNRRAVGPIATSAIFRLLVASDRARAAAQREPATLDPETLAALNVWGAVE